VLFDRLVAMMPCGVVPATIASDDRELMSG
jgi:hypothetical protein